MKKTCCVFDILQTFALKKKLGKSRRYKAEKGPITTEPYSCQICLWPLSQIRSDHPKAIKFFL